MIEFSNKYRSKQEEILDDTSLRGSEMEAMLSDLETVNTLLGGDKVTLFGIVSLLTNTNKERVITILDVGCGDGAFLRKLETFGKKNGYQFKLVGIDANAFIIDQAILRSHHQPNISFEQKNIFSKDALHPQYDIALCTLFLHHFDTKQIISILDKLTAEAKIGVVVNDLERNWFAFWLFRLFSSIFIKTHIAKHDGLVSVARAFKRSELIAISETIAQTTYTLKKKWAFRWQLILKKK